jgi:hypothetical protein
VVSVGATKHISSVNWRKVIENFRFGYQHRDPCEILLTELMANAIDAGADKIHVELDGGIPRVLRFMDNGSGMSKKAFSDYHNLGSLHKHKGSGIGWAGIGAKLYIDRCQSVYTETRSKTFLGASDWQFPKSEPAPVWREVPPRGLRGGGCGTAVEIVISAKKDCGRLTAEMIEATILSNYNYAMKPVGNVVVTVNGARLAPFNPTDLALQSRDVEVSLKKGASARGRLILLKEEAPPGFGLISIVVHGKTVGEQYDFRQFARISEPDTISGYVQCDDLIQVTTTSKDNFNRRTSEWRDFDSKVGRIFSSWLQEIGHLEKVETDVGLEDLAKELQSQINEIFKLPEIRELKLDLFQRIAQRLTTIRDPTGDTLGADVPGVQTVPGTLGGEGTGKGVTTPGDEPGIGVEIDTGGDTNVTEKQRRLRSGIQLAYVDRPGRVERAYVDPGLQAIAVNKANPAFRCAELIGGIEFYTIDECLRVVCETIEDEEQRAAILNSLFQGYLKTTTEE